MRMAAICLSSIAGVSVMETSIVLGRHVTTFFNRFLFRKSQSSSPSPAPFSYMKTCNSLRLLRYYRIQPKEMPQSRSIVVSGPSGCGKSTIIKRLMKEFPEKFGFSVSHTTRLPRPGEVHGKDYHFTTREAMQKEIDCGEFLEHAVFNNNFYGTSKRAVQDVFKEGRVCILDIDRQGVISVKKTDLDCVLVFVKPPSLEELEKRLRGRGTETEDSIQRRLNTSKEEFAYAEIPGSYDYILANDHLDTAYEEFKLIIDKEVTKLF
ncbi:guanylate kinase-like [Rhopilema esculentum]|uniref:guanylate kinase-like n=1 Tax=Rhopilema esculentum TaxID=499914 RepID=UPI0031DB28F4